MKQLRERKGWTTWELSVEANLKFDTVRGLETGEQRTRLHTIRKIAETLGTDPEGLFDLAKELASDAAERFPRPAELHRQGDLFRLLTERSRIAAARIDELRAGATLHVSLGRGLYVPRDVEDEIVQELLGAPDERRLAVVDGEPGTGKSSLLWHIRQRLDARDDCIAWLFDAIELPSVFAAGGSTPAVSDALRELVDDLLANGQRVVVLVDTVDVAFNSTTPPAELLQFFKALNDLGVDVVVASRPLEARHFHLLSARVFHLFEYNDTELAQAISNYAAAFVGEVGLDQAQLHVEALLSAVAQGFPVREICRNPLTLRMLYTVYAPNQINVFDVNVIALYNEFWRRRVEKDVRHDFEPDNAEQDLSPAAMRIAVVMLVEGVPEVPRELLEQELAHAGVPSSQLRGLESRGVVATAAIGAQNLTSFFHQTFFEHAAAVSIVRLGGAAALDALYRRWLETDENPFLGAVFERTLVLAEHGVFAVRAKADEVLDKLAQAGPSAAAVLAYVFVHRSSVPEAVRQFVFNAIANEDPLLIERLLDVAANAAKSRQADLFDALSAIMNIESGRWVSRALSLLLRFWGGNAERIAHLLAASPKLPTILGGRYKVPEARDAYLAFLASLAMEEARREWVLDQLVHLFGHADKIDSDDFALGILTTLRAIAPHVPGFVPRFVDAAQIGARSGKLKALPVARELGGALHEEWKVSATPASAVLADLIAAPHRDLYLNARLFGLGFLLAASTPGEVLQTFQETGNVNDVALRVGLGRVTWATALSQIAETWPERKQEGLFADIRELAASEQNGDVYAATVRQAWLEGRPSERLLTGLFNTRWTTPEFWGDETLGGRRLVDAAAERIEPAMAFLGVLAATPRRFSKLAPSVMQQIKFCMRPEPIELMGLGLAIEFGDPGVALALLQRRDVPPQWPADRSERLRGLLDDLRGRRDVSSRRVHSELELELARLGLAPTFRWEAFRARLIQDEDDVVRSRLIMAFGHLPDAVNDTVARVAWLIQFAASAGLRTRTAVLELATSVTDRDPALAPSITPMLMDVAFNGDTEGNLVALLQGPIYALYRTEDPRTGAIFKDIIARSANLPTHSCLRISRVFRHLSSLIMRRLDDASRAELLESVPNVNRYLGRLIVQGAVEAGTQSLLPRLKTIAENPAVGADVISMTRRYIRREMRTTGLGRWPELYTLFAAAQLTSAP